MPDAPRPLLSRADLDLLAAWRGGCEVLRYTRAGVLVGLYRTADASLDTDAGAWTTMCEEHSTLVGHATRRDAEAHLSAPDGWCDYCRGAEFRGESGTVQSWQRERDERDRAEGERTAAVNAEARACELRAARTALHRRAVRDGLLARRSP